MLDQNLIKIHEHGNSTARIIHVLTGLSLYLSKEIIEANLHGQMQIDSVEEEYTLVTTLLPLKLVSQPHT